MPSCVVPNYELLKGVFFLQVTGGGGYTKENVARCWTVETGILLDAELPDGTLMHLCLMGMLCFPLQFSDIYDLLASISNTNIFFCSFLPLLRLSIFSSFSWPRVQCFWYILLSACLAKLKIEKQLFSSKKSYVKSNLLK